MQFPILFSLGRIVVTPGVMAVLTYTEITTALRRHQVGDWGHVCQEDRAANRRALLEGCRLLSEYRSESGAKFWVITEADRSVTTLLLPSEY